MLIVGEKEKSSETVSVRKHQVGDVGTFSFEEFKTSLLEEIENKALPESSN